MSSVELKHKPLVEAILEFKWELPTQTADGIEADPYYSLLLGRFSERLGSDYPIHEPLPAAQIPNNLVTHVPKHRFRTSRDGWPLIQVGPGVMTLNETDGYTWIDFKNRCRQALESLLSAHPAKEEFKAQDIMLRYIDAVDVDFGQESVFDFLREKMKTNISLPDGLFADDRVKMNPVGFNWQVSFPTDDLGGNATLRFSVGKRNDRPALIWETLVQTAKGRVPPIPDGSMEWLEKAHELTHDWFFLMIDGELKRRFSGEW